MRRIFLTAILLVASSLVVDSSAQQIVKKRIGSYIENGNVVVAEANTTLAVDITVETERIVAGPYAKHAQRLFGVQAPLVNNVRYRIINSNVAIVDEPTYLASENVDAVQYCGSQPNIDDVFPKVLPDRMSKNNLSVDAAADRAAEQIFALRTARLELITAELGDGVYGAGLESALREIDDLEREYLELFYGKRIVTTSTHRYYIPVKPAEFEEVQPVVVPEGEKAPAEVVVAEPKMLPASYIVARFAPNVGLVEATDLQGDIILVTINPTEMSYPESDVKGKVVYRYANNSEVTMSLGHDVISKRVLPIYEFGRTVTFLAPSK